jgi:hypothetical protein
MRSINRRKPALILLALSAALGASAPAATADTTPTPTAEVSVGFTAAHDVAVANSGPSTAYNITVTERWSQSTNGTTAFLHTLSTNGCVANLIIGLKIGGVTCTIPSLGPRQDEVIYAQYSVGPMGGHGVNAITFTATAWSTTTLDPNPANNTASVRLQWAFGGGWVG